MINWHNGQHAHLNTQEEVNKTGKAEKRTVKIKQFKTITKKVKHIIIFSPSNYSNTIKPYTFPLVEYVKTTVNQSKNLPRRPNSWNCQQTQLSSAPIRRSVFCQQLNKHIHFQQIHLGNFFPHLNLINNQQTFSYVRLDVELWWWLHA